MRKRSAIISFIAGSLVVAGTVTGVFSPPATQAQNPTPPPPPPPEARVAVYIPPGPSNRPPASTADTEAELADRALEAINSRGHVKDGAVKVVLSKKLTVADLTEAGLLGKVNPAVLPPESAMAIVIMKGDFNMTKSIVGGGSNDSYVAYLYDLQVGSIVGEFSSQDGTLFKKILQDPSLPDMVPLSTPTGLPFGVSSKVATKN